MKFSSMILPAAALTMLFAACQDEDFGFTTKDVKSAKYDQEFIKAFGEVDPNQDWSMAAETRALVNLPNIQGTAKMNIMTGDPHNASTRLLGQVWLQNGQAELTFDAIEGKNNVFVTVEQDGKYKLYGQYNIVNGMLYIGNVEMPVAAAETRAFSAVCPAEKDGDPVIIDGITFESNNPTQIGWTYQPSGWQPKSMTYEEWEAAALAALPNSNQTIYTNESLFVYKRDLVDFSNAILKNLVKDGNGVIQSGPVVDEENQEITYYYNANTFFKKSITEWQKSYTIDNQTHELNSTDGPWTLESLSVISEECSSTDAGAYYVGVQPDKTKWQRRQDGSVTPYNAAGHPKWQYISNIETDAASPWYIGWGESLFGQGALFAESVEYWADSKMALYDDASIETMEKGLEIITTEGMTITMPYIFGCTDYYDQFGYIYWRDGQDPLEQTHYVLVNDARPSKNIYYDAYGENGTPAGNKDLTTYVQNTQNSGNYKGQSEQALNQYVAQANKAVYGTSYRLMYWDETNEKFTYEFPAGLHIAFFIDDLANENNQKNHTGHLAGRYNYSLPEFNERIGHTSPANGKDRPGGPAGLVKCITFTSNGIHYVGFGDNCGDEDLNDMVFVINGATPNNKLETCPIIWHINENGDSGPSVETDIFEREVVIVGKTYNSPTATPTNGAKVFKGWSSTPDNSSNDLFTSKTNAPTTSTEAIHYYAIWEIQEDPSGDPEWQSWIFACEDLGGSYDYDFNDLVFAVQKTAIAGSDNVKLELIPLAAGGTLNAEVWYGDTKINEIHKLLGSDDYKTQNLGGTPGTAVTLAESVSASITVSSIARSIKIQVTQGEGDVKNGSYTLSHTDHNKNYKTPEILILPGGWDWPNEGVLITDVYPGFASWSGDITATDWINTKEEGTVAGEHYIVNPLKGGNEPVGPTPSNYGIELSTRTVDVMSNGSPKPMLGISIADLLEVVHDNTPAIITLVCSSIDPYTRSAGAVDYQGWVNWIGTVVIDDNAKTVTISLTGDQYHKFVTPSAGDNALIDSYGITVSKVYVKNGSDHSGSGEGGLDF